MTSRLGVRIETTLRALASGMSRRLPSDAPVRRILVAHYLLLGDTILLAPLLKALAIRYPEAERVVLARPAVAPLFEHRPYGATALVFDRRDAGTRRRIIDSGPYDLAIVPDDNRYAWLARAAGARRVIGFANDRPAWKNRMLDRAVPYPSRPAAWADLVALALQGDGGTVVPSPFVVGEWAAPSFVPFERPSSRYAVLHVGASTPLKRWPPARWRALADRLAADGLAIVWSGGAAERDALAAVGPRDGEHDRVGRLDLAQLWHLLAGAQLLVCPDTGITHLARLTGVRTVALFGPGSVVVHGAGAFWAEAPFETVTIDDFPCRDQHTLYRRDVPWVRRCGRRFDATVAPGGREDAGACGRALCMEGLSAAAVIDAVIDAGGRCSGRVRDGPPMTEPTVATAKPTSAVERLLFFGWWSVMALLPIGHVTGLRNTWTTLVVVATLVWLGRDAWHPLPGRKTMLLLLAWCAATIGWSTVPEVSFGKWRSDLLLPLLAYVAAHGYVIRSGSCRPIVGGIMTGIAMLMLLSLAVFVPASLVPAVSHLLRFESFANLASPLPVWYPGVGDASMAASLAAALLVGAPRLLPDIRRAWWVAGWVAITIVVLVSNNRNAALAIPFVVGVASLLMRRTTASLRPMRWKRWMLAGTAGLVVATALVAMMESSARERLRIIGAPVRSDRSALVVLTERDTRPTIWAYYTRLALRAPIVGVGFGRTVPGIHYRTQDDRDLARVEFNAYIHAHNLFLDWWLQTGAIGVALLVGLLCVIVGHAHRLARSATGVEAKAALVMLHALIALMLIRDATDDFLVYGMATLFWALLGCIGASVGAARDPVVSARRDP